MRSEPRDTDAQRPSDKDSYKRFSDFDAKTLAGDATGEGQRILEICKRYSFQFPAEVPLTRIAAKYVQMREGNALRILPPETFEKFSERSSHIEFRLAREWLDKVYFLQRALDEAFAAGTIDQETVDQVQRDIGILDIEAVFKFLLDEHGVAVKIPRTGTDTNW
ncbi:hypothetical protein A3F28_02165 [Candidatus Uhrbacteria bacterium RIFCSPHIGHO2_12_FULL_57_11]|uniref:Uncharacterized protein n=2 Tax=Parcubacteria group TaxID=1794811 RepID=A0A1F7UNM2_9BACT|nr:MAG: hypothetical protein A2680_02745 [Candidatus Kaiserbacteria bacterium RIFCSPHIGHO2_01_FULL_55_37]OGG65480.1 MAG: hypothetical protein A3D71_00985 [Candidatus Kaiserbacteria bacterium RIFCSPHIGHO2_02_FULL_55_20]OGL79354.1 MAG: hypothetical protein A3F28_02165 [Candidatus Uhrbacteria bacterium RIFCSPHIGHO2_12_FULL_57_11]